MEALDRFFMQIPPALLTGKRANWLFIFLEMLTATAMGFFERQIERAVGLALFVPLIMLVGGLRLSGGGAGGCHGAGNILQHCRVRLTRYVVIGVNSSSTSDDKLNRVAYVP